MPRSLLAAYAFAVSMSKALSFAPYIKRSRHNNFSYDANRLKLSTSPGDVVSVLAQVPSPVLYPAIFATCFRIGAALAVIGQPRLPSDDTLYSDRQVGSKVIRLPGLGSRLRVFYPISDDYANQISVNISSKSDCRYCTDGRATSDGMAGLVGFRQVGLSFLLAHLADAHSGCYIDEDDNTANDSVLAFCKEGAPLLVYSHGYGGNMDMATYFLRTIAKRGIVVAAIEHTDGTASSTVLPGDRRLDFDSSLFSLKDGLDRRAEELLEAVDFLPSLLPGFSGRIFLGGHSYGCPSALLASQRQRPWSSPKIAGLILHDPALSMGRGIQLPPKIPTVSYVSDEYNRGNIRCGDATYHVQGAFHGNFVDAPLWAPLWVMRTLSVLIPACGPSDPEIVHRELAESARAFCFGPEENPLASKAVGSQSLFERVG